MDPDIPVAPDDFFRALVENTAEGMLTIDEESTIRYANPAIEDLLGYSPEELVGESKMVIIPERLRSIHEEALARYVESDERSIDWDGMELPALHKDGTEVPTLISLREHTHEDERYLTGIVRDISQQREREAELHDQKERLDDFADILAHDIRNSLSVAQGYTDLARREHDAPELDTVSESLDRIEKLVADILALSKEGRYVGETEPVPIAACARDAWRTVHADTATFIVELGEATVDADRSRLQQLFENLFRNAVDHVGETVTVRVGSLADDDGIYVADDGPGVPPDVREEVFDHGFSTRDHGTGYGLPIVRQIATGHGWTVDVVDGETGGARFELRGLDIRS
ncbi:two-component system sensor histidine kinase NtrB [Halobaculum roseum]|uniref:histidine kinase n=1 Tax=Halobaculum roseum TaxID=2175149 RepID=A0ABD5MQA9_9EURY|nr:PAS domain-containing sensor histidine kinase [Halobaculum roseum]QZY04568.1 PAS domain-containing sensor histidine kinase [Halobaculum roseum]